MDCQQLLDANGPSKIRDNGGLEFKGMFQELVKNMELIATRAELGNIRATQPVNESTKSSEKA